MERVCFRMFIKLDRVDEYEAEHQQVWPEVLDALRKSGWHNYSIFLNKEDGCLITYCEFEDFKKSLDSIAREEISLKWQARMVEYFVPVPGLKPADAFDQFVELFHLA